jgi:hypothetical protein
MAFEVDASAATWSGHMSLEEGEPNRLPTGVCRLAFTSSSLHNAEKHQRKLQPHLASIHSNPEATEYSRQSLNKNSSQNGLGSSELGRTIVSPTGAAQPGPKSMHYHLASLHSMNGGACELVTSL